MTVTNGADTTADPRSATAHTSQRAIHFPLLLTAAGLAGIGGAFVIGGLLRAHTFSRYPGHARDAVGLSAE